MLPDLEIIWSTPVKHELNGVVFYTREWLIPLCHRQPFFNYWKSYKGHLLSKGYYVEKRGDYDWYLIEKRNSPLDFVELKKYVAKKEYNTDDTPLKPYKVKNTEGLLPWQIDSVSKIVSAINKWNAAVDGSDLGCGKTYTAIAAIRELKSKFVVICPKAVKESWRRVVSNHFNMDDSCLGITNYEQLRIGNPKSTIASYIKNKKTHRKVFTWKLPKNTIIIWDEAQKLKSHKTQNSKVCMAAHKDGYRMLFCSATMASSPLELKTIGECIGLFKGFKQYYQWALDHGCKKGFFGGLEFDYNKKSLIKLHHDIFVNRGVRLKRETIPEFPVSLILSDVYDIGKENTNKVNEIYAEMKKELQIIELKEKKNKNAIKMVTMLRARQKVEMLKVPLLVELAENGIENGMSVVIFCNFTDTINALSERLNTKCIVDGKTSDKLRQQNIDNFQADKEQIILVNISAGGAGLSLHQLGDKRPRMAIHCPNYSAVLTRQALGRIWRTGSTTKSVQKIVYLANTIEEEVNKAVNSKLKNLDLLNDGDLTKGV